MYVNFLLSQLFFKYLLLQKKCHMGGTSATRNGYLNMGKVPYSQKEISWVVGTEVVLVTLLLFPLSELILLLPTDGRLLLLMFHLMLDCWVDIVLSFPFLIVSV